MKEFLSLLFHFRKRELFILPTNNVFVQFFRFIFVGGIATLVDLFSTTFCYETLGLRAARINLFGFDGGVLLASTVGFVLGLVVNYVLSVLWIFRSENINRVKEFTAFTVIGLIGLGIKLLAVAVMERYIFDLHTPLFGLLPMVTVVNIIASFIAFLWNFSARKFFLYSGRNDERLKK